MRNYGIILSLLLIVPTTAFTADNSGNHAIWGVGNKACISYTKAREADDYNAFKNYLMGFLTAYNILTPETYRLSGSMNLNEILTWFDDYCELKAVNGFEQAIYDFTVEHYGNRAKKSASLSRGR